MSLLFAQIRNSIFLSPQHLPLLVEVMLRHFESNHNIFLENQLWMHGKAVSLLLIHAGINPIFRLSQIWDTQLGIYLVTCSAARGWRTRQWFSSPILHEL